MTRKNRDMGKIFQAAIGYYVELEGIRKGNATTFVGEVVKVEMSGLKFQVHFNYDGTKKAIYYSKLGELILEPKSDDVTILMDTIETIMVAF